MTKANGSSPNRFGEKLGDWLGETRGAILSILKEAPSLSITKLAEKMGVSTTAIEKSIAWLKVNGYLLRFGSARVGRWEVVVK